MDVIREAFSQALDYKKAWDDYNRRKAAGEPNLIPPRRDLKLDPLVEVLEGQALSAHPLLPRRRNSANDPRGRGVPLQGRNLQHVLEGYKVADEIAQHGAGGSTFSDWWAYKMEAFDAIPYNAALMTERGVVVSVNSDDASEATHLNQEAAKTMKWGGLSHDEALKLVTLNPAIQLHIANRVGSLEAGKDADIDIYDKDPLSVYSVAQKVLIDGRVYFDREKDIAGRAALEPEKKDLLEKAKKNAEKKAEEKKSEEKKSGEKKPEEKKPEEKPKPPQGQFDQGGAR